MSLYILSLISILLYREYTLIVIYTLMAIKRISAELKYKPLNLNLALNLVKAKQEDRRRGAPRDPLILIAYFSLLLNIRV